MFLYTEKEVLAFEEQISNEFDLVASKADSLSHQFLKEIQEGSSLIFLIGDVSEMMNQFLLKINQNYSLVVYTDFADFSSIMKSMEKADVIVDALGQVKSEMIDQLVSWMNESQKQIISINAPYGLNLESGIVEHSAIAATDTYVLGAYRLGYFLNDGLDYTGKLHLIDRIYPKELPQSNYQLIDHFDFSIPSRKHHSNKYTYGNLHFVGGDDPYFGSIQLSAMSALRCGAGLVHIWNQSNSNPLFLDPIYHHYESSSDLFVTKNPDIYVVGPGMKVNQDSKSVVYALMNSPLPCIFDAAALMLVDSLTTVKGIKVLTPHMGELAKMSNQTTEYTQKHVFEFMRPWMDSGYTVILKDSITIIGTKNQFYLLNFGGPYMSKAGFGDVLDGILATRIFQNSNILQALIESVFIHAQSAKRCKEEFSCSGVLASDLLIAIPKIMKQKENKNGLE